jgi:SnoaL-like domain
MNAFEDRIRVLEDRLQRLEDDRAIRELLASYGFNADQGRAEAYVAMYAEDGALDLSRGPGAPQKERGSVAADELEHEVVIRFEGHEELRGFITDPDGHKRLEGKCLHFMGNNLKTRIDGDRAVAESYNLTLVRRQNEFVLFNAAVNRWTLRKVDGQWRIQECKRRRPGTAEFGDINL